MKCDLRKQVLDFYSEEGLDKAICLADGLVYTNEYGNSKKYVQEIHGDVCETIIQCGLLEIAREHLSEVKIYDKGLLYKGKPYIYTCDKENSLPLNLYNENIDKVKLLLNL